MTKAAGGIIDVTDLPAVGVPLDIVANTASSYVAGLATAVLFIGGTHVALSGTITRAAGLQRASAYIGTVPVGLRPTQQRRLMCTLGNSAPGAGESGTSGLLIETTGEIRLTANATLLGAQTVAYLDAVMYPL